MPKAQNSQPADTIEVTVDNEKRDLFMSFGLLDHLSRIIIDPSRIGVIFTDPDLREEVLKAALAERTKSGKIQETIDDLLDFEISTTDYEKILDWVAEHVTSFFVRSLKKVVQVTERNAEGLKGLESFLGGSSASASPTPSAGSAE